MTDNWVTIDAECVLYVDRGTTTILCDRLPSPVTLVLKISDSQEAKLEALGLSPSLEEASLGEPPMTDG